MGTNIKQAPKAIYKGHTIIRTKAGYEMDGKIYPTLVQAADDIV